MTELRQDIEELSLQAVMCSDVKSGGQSIDELIPVVMRVRERAERELAIDVMSCAEALIQALQEAENSGRIQEALLRLQQAAAADNSEPSDSQAISKDPELLRDFVMESGDHLSSIESQLLVLERDPGNSEALHSIFRGFHTIKGLAGFLELWDVQKLAHEVETVLDAARNGCLSIGGSAIDVILAGADYLRRWLVHLDSMLEGRASTPPCADPGLLARIHALGEAQPSDPGAAPPASDLGKLASAVEVAADEQPSARATTSRHAGSSAVKVDTAKLDYLVDMAGEMVIAQSMVHHDPELSNKSPRLQKNLAQLARITAELQKTAMSMRLVPIGPLFRRMERLVRDLARQFGKQVAMETEGDDIELDRHIVEELADPLMHMVRNALDHGIELPAERQAAGKDATAKLVLRARHHAGQVVIEIADNGRGLDREKILAKAIQKNLISSGEGLSDQDVHNLIFLPGFSTAEQVTNVSGRGVGMDVVRRHIEKLRGRMEIQSARGKGAIFFLKLPLTLAIIDGLIVGVGPERYIVPLFGVREVLRPGDDTIWTVQQRSETALIRGSLIPMMRLYRRFAIEPRSEDPADSVLLVAEVEGKRFCLLVDEVIGKQEVVIKTLGDAFKDVAGVAGGAILGDGRIGLILDLDRLYKDGREDAGS